MVIVEVPTLCFLRLATTGLGPRAGGEKVVISGIHVLREERKGFFVNRLQDGVLIAGFGEAAVDERVEGMGLTGNQSRVNGELPPRRANGEPEDLGCRDAV